MDKNPGKNDNSRRRNKAKRKRDYKAFDNLGNNIKEITEIYNGIYNLKRDKEPNYDDYINKLKKGINYNKNINEKENLFE